MIFFLPLLLAFSAQAVSIYGFDNREEAFTHGDKTEIIKATAALIPKQYLVADATGFKVEGPSLKNEFQLCDGERFSEQPSVSDCSGTLVAPDLIYTAGHCYRQPKVCEKALWVFDYKLEKEEQKEIHLTTDEVYKCEKILYQSTSQKDGLDFALIKLDRDVVGRSPVLISQEDFTKKENIFMIGTPLGTPLKVADYGQVLDVEKVLSKTNLDAFSANSGSGVYSAFTMELKGTLISGSMDFDFQKGCHISRVQKAKVGREIVLDVSALRKLLESHPTDVFASRALLAPHAKRARPSLGHRLLNWLDI